jgi:TetR/AcrR family transcriptional regulator, transcriptional repressor for nem operon
MTDSVPGKRDRLVAAAADLLHRQGVAATTLAEVATAAGVPPGNVYYYFKTKDQLVEAVIDAHAQAIRGMLDSFNNHRSPKARLQAFARAIGHNADLSARHGCPHGTLCVELDKRDDGLDRTAAGLMEIYLGWAEDQFRAMGRKDARDLAATFVSVYQGASLLANTFRDPELLQAQVRWLQRWIDSLS